MMKLEFHHLLPSQGWHIRLEMRVLVSGKITPTTARHASSCITGMLMSSKRRLAKSTVAVMHKSKSSDGILLRLLAGDYIELMHHGSLGPLAIV